MATHCPVTGVTGHAATPAWPACSETAPEPLVAIAPPLAVPAAAFVAPPLVTFPSELAVRPQASANRAQQPTGRQDLDRRWDRLKSIWRRFEGAECGRIWTSCVG